MTKLPPRRQFEPWQNSLPHYSLSSHQLLFHSPCTSRHSTNLQTLSDAASQDLAVTSQQKHTHPHTPTPTHSPDVALDRVTSYSLYVTAVTASLNCHGNWVTQDYMFGSALMPVMRTENRGEVTRRRSRGNILFISVRTRLVSSLTGGHKRLSALTFMNFWLCLS